jgi:hypothetical protein
MAQHLTYSTGIVYTPTMHSAITATATSVAQLVAGARGVMIEYTEGGVVLNRSGVLTITVSSDGGTNYRAYSMLISNAANSNSQTLLRVASITRNAAGTDICWLTPETLAGITHIKAVVTITDGGTPTGNFTVKAAVCY